MVGIKLCNTKHSYVLNLSFLLCHLYSQTWKIPASRVLVSKYSVKHETPFILERQKAKAGRAQGELTPPADSAAAMARPWDRPARTRFTGYGNHLLMSSHNLGLEPFEKKTFIHLQNSIIRFHKCKDKNVLSFIMDYNIWGLIAL